MALWTYNTVPAVHGDLAPILSPSMGPAAFDKRLPRDPGLRWSHSPQEDVRLSRLTGGGRLCLVAAVPAVAMKRDLRQFPARGD